MKRAGQFVTSIFFGSVILMSCRQDRLLTTPTESGTPPTSLHKTIAVLGLIANVNYNLVRNSEAALSVNTLKINDALNNNADLKAYIGNDWQVVWGPVTSNSLKKKPSGAVSVADSFVTDNTMYVARGTNLATGKAMYVVGIAGTNIVSKKAWQMEDFNILKEANWGQPNSGKISAGSMVGLMILTTMKDARTGKTLLEFLYAQPDINTAEVACTGHSLGGALSPLIALKCIEWKEQLNYTTTISVYPIAGPTPGDGQFARYAAGKFGGSYHSVINNYDIVPNSWQKDMFARIPSMYNRSPPFNSGERRGYRLSAFYRSAYDVLKVIVNLRGYQRIAPEQEYAFNGMPNVYQNHDGTFLKEAGYQHVKAYFHDGFGFPQPVVDAITKLIAN